MTKPKPLKPDKLMVQKIRRVANDMHRLAIQMRFYRGRDCERLQKHADEMAGAANLALEWAYNLDLGL
jgi:hypothetical protein